MTEPTDGTSRTALWDRHIPPHWTVRPFFATARVRREPNAGLKDDNLLSLSFGRIVRKNIDTSEGLLPESFGTYQIVHPGDTVFRFTDLQNDQRSLRSGLVAERGIITSAYLAVEPTGVDPHYFAYLMRAYDLNKVFYGQSGGVRQSLKFGDVRRLPVLLPPLNEQRAIAAYLDDATASIDALIARQRELIELLRERRVATVSTAVNPQDSTLVQRGWREVRMKHVGTAMTGLTYAPEQVATEGVLVLRSGNIQDGTVTTDDAVFVSATIPDELRVRSGDILICSRSGSAELVGKHARIPDSLVGQTWGAFMTVLRSDRNEYLQWVLSSQLFREQMGLFSTSTINQLTLGTLRNLRFWMPPAHEQTRIAAQLDDQTTKIDALIAKASEHIELAGERRSALITAAVTGQFDVRAASREVA